MKNAATLALIMGRIDRDKPLLPGEKKLLREALESLAELTDMVNDQCGCSTGQIPVVTTPLPCVALCIYKGQPHVMCDVLLDPDAGRP